MERSELTDCACDVRQNWDPVFTQLMTYDRTCKITNVGAEHLRRETSLSPREGRKNTSPRQSSGGESEEKEGSSEIRDIFHGSQIVWSTDGAGEQRWQME
jgi:hypothetical protein